MNHKQERITLRIFDDTGQAALRNLLAEIEERVSIEHIGEILFSVLNELISNAAKANMKRVFFREAQYDFADSESYRKGLEEFKLRYPRLHKSPDYYAALRDLNLTVAVEIDLDRQRLLIFVENNTLMNDEEERRIREKLAGAMQSRDLIEFSIQYGDDTEGEGLGLAMVVQLIRHLGHNPDYFRVYIKGDRTIARLEFPLSKDYTPIRARQQSEESSSATTGP